MDADDRPPSTKALQPSDPGSTHRRLRDMPNQHVVHFSVAVLGGAGVNAGAFGSGNTVHVAAADDHQHSETAVAVMDRHYVCVGHVMQGDEEVMSALVRPGTDNSLPGGVRVVGTRAEVVFGDFQ
ncbi:hypothetical protein B484DRAFT_401200 [Ochromonadaceae sp. CCMP2298]|nr:hypothetical protein B484DRAFT_401200 [Ochromonadaceae sp. CCMP2298]